MALLGEGVCRERLQYNEAVPVGSHLIGPVSLGDKEVRVHLDSQAGVHRGMGGAVCQPVGTSGKPAPSTPWTPGLQNHDTCLLLKLFCPWDSVLVAQADHLYWLITEVEGARLCPVATPWPHGRSARCLITSLGSTFHIKPASPGWGRL